MERNSHISKGILELLISKYKDAFETRFNKLQLSVHFTSNGQPPTPDEYRNTPETTEVAGSFVKVGRDYRIGINLNLSVELQLLSFFHEFGHAMYRREANEAIDSKEAQIRTETAALSKSLELADIEGLPQIARLAVHSANLLAITGSDSVYSAALDNVRNKPLWLKYSRRSQ
jgi:hypothetical protein